MILAILGLFIKALPGPILGYLERKASSHNQALRIEAEQEIARRAAQRDVLIKEADHWAAWLPRFLIAFSVALYVAAIFAVSTFQLSWVVLQVPDEMEPVVSVVVGGLFLEKITRIAKR
jgi:hypothetical protein